MKFDIGVKYGTFSLDALVGEGNMSYEVVLVRKIRAFLKMRQFERALELQEEHTGLVGINLENQVLLLEILLGLRRLERAEPLGDMLCEQYPRSARVYFLNGKVKYYLNRFKQAEALIRVSLELYPKALGEVWLAKCLGRQGSYGQAFSILSRLDQQHWLVLQELGWLFESQKKLELAISYYRKALLNKKADEKFLSTKIEALEAMLVDQSQLLDEMEVLESFGEEIPQHLLPAYFQSSLEKGEQEKMRQYVTDHLDSFTPRLSKNLAWVCYRAPCYDLALNLFMHAFPDLKGDYKALNSMQKAARICHKIPALIQFYRKSATQNRQLYGRIKSLERELDRQ